jgi:hypothetical protein
LRISPMWCRTMTCITLVALLLALSSKAIGQPAPAYDAQQMPGVAPGAVRPAPDPAFHGIPMNPAVAPRPPQAPGWAPGAYEHGGPRVGSPYYWSNSNVMAAPAYGPPPAYGPLPGYAHLGAPACGCQHRGGGWGAYPAATMGGYWVPAYYGSALYHGSMGYGGWGAPAGGGDPYMDHFGAGFHRHSNQGHFRFPYYNYRSPWYSPGPPSFNRDTNFPW